MLKKSRFFHYIRYLVFFDDFTILWHWIFIEIIAREIFSEVAERGIRKMRLGI